MMSTYSFTEIMKDRMDLATKERQEISQKVDKVVTLQGDQEVRIRLLEDGQGELELKVDKIENKVFSKE
ncbi:hypothetical protein CGI99_20590 [Vibrio parahaemolyticus]|nr:hypothetical protein CGI99_20590 [Vibrio parahaemolyticus]